MGRDVQMHVITELADSKYDSLTVLSLIKCVYTQLSCISYNIIINYCNMYMIVAFRRNN